MLEATPINFHQYDCPDMNWKIIIPMDMANRIREKSLKASDLYKNTLGSWGKLGTGKVVSLENRLPIGCWVSSSQSWIHLHK